MARRAGGIVLAYDAGCGVCSRFRVLVGFLDARKRIHFVDIGEAGSSGLLDDVPHALRSASFHIVSGEGEEAFGGGVASGPGAIIPLVKALSPSAWKLVRRVPSFGAALRLGYSTLSRLHRGCSIYHGEAKRRGS